MTGLEAFEVLSVILEHPVCVGKYKWITTNIKNILGQEIGISWDYSVFGWTPLVRKGKLDEKRQ